MSPFLAFMHWLPAFLAATVTILGSITTVCVGGSTLIRLVNRLAKRPWLEKAAAYLDMGGIALKRAQTATEAAEAKATAVSAALPADAPKDGAS